MQNPQGEIQSETQPEVILQAILLESPSLQVLGDEQVSFPRGCPASRTEAMETPCPRKANLLWKGQSEVFVQRLVKPKLLSEEVAQPVKPRAPLPPSRWLAPLPMLVTS